MLLLNPKHVRRPTQTLLRPFTLSGEYAKRIGIPDGTKVLYTEMSLERRPNQDPNTIYMAEIIDAENHDYLGGTLFVSRER